MKKFICVATVLVVAGFVIAKDNNNLMCCTPSSYIIRERAKFLCFDPKKDTTAPIRLVCDTYGRLSNFSVTSEMIEFQVTPLFKVSFGSDLACYGNMTNDRKNLTELKFVSMLCLDKEEYYVQRDIILDYCDIVSIVFLGLTTIIYVTFSELRDLFGKSVINFCGSLTIGLGIMSIMKLMTYEDMTLCAIRGFLAYFFLVASFFWSNSISIQVLRDTRRPCTEDYSWREFKWYVLYSWGLPIVLTTTMAIVNYHPGHHRKPGIGLNHCWFLDKAQQWYYLNSVILLLLMINLVIFVYVATIFWRFSIVTTHMKTLKFKLSMIIRLIVVMGLPWLLEMISSAIGNNTSVIVIILDMITSMQGLMIFAVLVVRKRVVKVLYQHGLLAWCSGRVERWLAAGIDATSVMEPNDIFLHDDNQRDEDGHD